MKEQLFSSEKVALPVEIDDIAINLGLVEQPVTEPQKEKKIVVDFSREYLEKIYKLETFIPYKDYENEEGYVCDLEKILTETYSKLPKESKQLLSLIYNKSVKDEGKDDLLMFLEDLLKKQDLKPIANDNKIIIDYDLTLFKNRLLHLVSFGSSTNRGSLSINREQFEEQSKTILEYLKENPNISADCFIMQAQEIYNQAVLSNKNKAL
jgi:hypothetical protein